MISYEAYFQALLTVLRLVATQETDPKAVAQTCATIAGRYRDGLPLPDVPVTQREYYQNHFLRFQTELRYYEACADAQAVWPIGDARECKAFWIRESNRRYQAMESYPILHTYWAQGATDRDEELFGSEPGIALHHAVVLAEFTALARYEWYLEEAFQDFFTTEES